MLTKFCAINSLRYL